MQYFDTLPKIIQTDEFGNSIILTNLLARASIITDLLKNPIVYYTYDIQDGDTPEIIAHKYYGNMYRYWIVLFANQILDPQWQWPMESSVFTNYIADKYPSIDPYSVAHSYEKIVTQTDLATNTITVNKVQLTEQQYDSLSEDRKSTRLNSSHIPLSRMPSSA